MPPVIEIDGLTCYAERGRVIFEDAGLVLNAGEKAVITAPLASGKSLLVKILSGIVVPDKGTVRIFGEDIGGLSKDRLNGVRKRMGFVFHDNVLISNLKVIENVALPLLYHTDLPSDEVMERALELLKLTGFAGDIWALPGPLPVYSRKEVSLAKALALDPEVLVCENLSYGLTGEELQNLFDLVIKYQKGRKDSLLLMTALSDAEINLVKPDRAIRIQGNRFVE